MWLQGVQAGRQLLSRLAEAEAAEARMSSQINSLKEAAAAAEARAAAAEARAAAAEERAAAMEARKGREALLMTVNAQLQEMMTQKIRELSRSSDEGLPF